MSLTDFVFQSLGDALNLNSAREKNMTPQESTICFNLARSLNLVVSSRQVGQILYVYDSRGQMRTWESFTTDFPLERLQAMARRI